VEAILFAGLQASGKSSFYRERFFATHLRINLDMLGTRHREWRLLRFCLETRMRFVVDNTNPARADRRRYIVPAKEAGFRVVGYYFQSRVEDCQRRNLRRAAPWQVPSAGLFGTSARLELPRFEEGFDELHYVKIAADGGFLVEPWREEV
jgi:predicted kinase